MLTFGSQCCLERSFAARRTWPDEWLDFWGDVYVANRLIAERGVLFETFLLAPLEVLSALGLLHTLRLDAHGLTIARATLAMLELAGARCSNGRWVEKLRHHQSKRARHRRRDIEGRLL